MFLRAPERKEKCGERRRPVPAINDRGQIVGIMDLENSVTRAALCTPAHRHDDDNDDNGKK